MLVELICSMFSKGGKDVLWQPPEDKRQSWLAFQSPKKDNQDGLGLTFCWNYDINCIINAGRIPSAAKSCSAEP